MSTGIGFRRLLPTVAGVAMLSSLTFASAFGGPLAITDEPLFLNEVPPPLNMLTMSRDHRMYYEAYNDASDLDGDGVLDINYKTSVKFTYYGYFDSFRCYKESGGVFSVSSATNDKTCPGDEWSGDWLNYVTTSRIDALRKVLYGGLRYEDTEGNTILQRAFIPQDAHSWGKEYTSVAVNGYDISQYTPLSLPSGSGTRRHLFANTTPSADAVVTGNANPAINGVAPPKLRVLESSNKRIWDWVSKERLVADSSFSGSIKDYIVRVQVCAAGTYDEKPAADRPPNNCKTYGSGKAKPTGLLQDYGENDSMYFGLLTGSYGKPHDGGVLRKAVGSLKDEIDLTTGTFKYKLDPPGIIGTIDRLRITNFNTDQYGCGWITDSSDAAGKCSMWGNPTAEMMYEVARYYAGKASPTGLFSSSANNAEETGIGLKVANWDATTDPYKTFPRCSKPFQTVISDISPSYDSDTVPGSAFTGYSADLSMNATTLGQKIWDNEFGSGKSLDIFIGDNGVVRDGAPTVKSASSFASIRGLSPEAPTKEGSYNSASVAHHALLNDLNGAPGDQKMQTFGVALASPLPEIAIKVGGKTITMVPFAKSVGGGYGISPDQGKYQPTNQIVDFYVDTLTATYGKFRVNFEDVEQGADHDMDAIAIYEYQVNGTNSVTITVTSEYAAGGIIQHMGYVISGAKESGTYLVVRDVDTAQGSDVDYFLDTPAGQPPGGNWQDKTYLPAGTASPVARTFTPADSGTAASTLKDPLFYAAKWGGFEDAPPKGNGNGIPDVVTEWDANNDKLPDNYFLVTNALKLKQQLGQAFQTILDRSGSASSASISSGSINDSTTLYQAIFDARNWSGQLAAYPISDGDSNNDGKRDANDLPEGALGMRIWEASSKMPGPGSRNVITVSSTPAASTTGIYRTASAFNWASLDANRRAQLNRGDGLGQERLAYLRGDRTSEGTGGFRTRSTILGDIINSGPIFVGEPNYRYPDAMQTKPYSGFRADKMNRAKTIYVGANDGMLHAFDAASGVERWAFVPASVFPNLHKLTDPAYSHTYYVDGTPTVADAYFGNAWHTVLTAGLNKGGQGVYALDVTNPEVTEASASSLLLWEFTDAQDADLGYTYSRPAVVKMKDGTWAAIFGNGYNNTDSRGGDDTHVSTTGNAVLYVVNVETGALIRKIDTGVGMAADPLKESRPNGLGTPAVVDLDGDRIPDVVYAGDLFGNLWKFDVSGSTSTTWDVAYRSGGVAQPLFTATDDNGKAQPITSRPQVRLGHSGVATVVLFGTGKFLEANDRNVANLSVQSFYGIYDRHTGKVADQVARSGLVEQTILGETTATLDGRTVAARVTSENAVDPVSKDGWYIDLLSPSGFEGEMQITDSVLRNGRVIFTTLIPDDDICAYGGQSWLMEMNAMTGSRLPYSPYDFNNDGTFNAKDLVKVGGKEYPATGIRNDAIWSRPGMVSSNSSDYAELSDSNAETRSIRSNPGPGATGRQSWRQLR